MSDNAPVEQELPAPNQAQFAPGSVPAATPRIDNDVTPDCLGDHAIGVAQRYYLGGINGTVVVLIENAYECGHTSSKRLVLLAPEPGEDLETWWTDTVFGLTGDPHDGCYRDRENASCEVRIVDAADHPELLNQTYSWEG